MHALWVIVDSPQVPASVHTEGMDAIKAKFMKKKYGDHDLETMITQGDGPIDITQLPMFSAVMNKQKKAAVSYTHLTLPTNRDV